MIYEWKAEDGKFRNFGDALTELLLKIEPPEVQEKMELSQDKLFYLVGSVISNEHMRSAIDSGYTPVFAGCGWRGESLDFELVSQAQFRGVRGPRTAAALRMHGVDVEVVGDSAYRLVDQLNIPRYKTQDYLVVPHIGDFGETPSGLEVLDVRVKDSVSILKLIEKIANAKFVLGGSMHACIIAHAYGVPFAPYGSDYIDCPPKWVDWFESVGLTWDKLQFCKNLEEGLDWYDNV